MIVQAYHELFLIWCTELGSKWGSEGSGFEPPFTKKTSAHREALCWTDYRCIRRRIGRKNEIHTGGTGTSRSMLRVSSQFPKVMFSQTKWGRSVSSFFFHPFAHFEESTSPAGELDRYMCISSAIPSGHPRKTCWGGWWRGSCCPGGTCGLGTPASWTEGTTTEGSFVWGFVRNLVTVHHEVS